MSGGPTGNLPSVMGHNFSQNPAANIPRSVFNRSHGFKTTFNSGDIVPFFVDEALPGDTFNLKVSTFARLSTPIVPVMDNLYCDTFYFAVPYRLVWSNFKKFMGEQASPGDSTSYLIPTMTSTAGTGYLVHSLSDYFGIPTGIPGITHSSLWHRAYNLIWNDWFRDQNLQTPVVVDLDDGPDTVTDYVVKKRGKRHDYFTSCLPWTQKGTAVSIPLGTSATVTRIPNAAYAIAYQSGTQAGSGAGNLTTNASNQLLVGGTLASLDPNGALIADLSTATAASINTLRQAFTLQKLYERDARGGTRYVEMVKSHFGVTSPDARMQRPEYLGGASTPINVTPTVQTSSTDATSPQGNLSCFGTFSHSGNNNGFTKSFTEHCLILGMFSVRADLNYQQGLNKMFSRSTRLDFYWPALANLGEQAVLNQEIYAQGTANPAQDIAVFGYQERYSEYRYKPSQITGKFRSTYATPLDIWHLAQKFTSLPVLNSTFITEAPPIARVIAVPTQPEFLFDAYLNLTCARPMPTHSVPGLGDNL